MGGRLGLVTPVIGLAGPTGVLPRLYTDLLIQTLRNRSPALANFLRMLAQRFVGMFADAGIKYRLNRSVETAAGAGIAEPDRLSEALLALTGYATPHLTSRLAVGTEPLLHYSGLFSSHPRSAERLRALVSDWLGREVEVVQFAGAWLPLAPEQRTSLAQGRATGAWNRLGVDAAVGVRAWDPQARVILRIGPLNHSAFTALLPDRRRLAAPRLAGARVPRLRNRIRGQPRARRTRGPAALPRQQRRSRPAARLEYLDPGAGPAAARHSPSRRRRGAFRGGNRRGRGGAGAEVDADTVTLKCHALYCRARCDNCLA